jgi:hypothetical protein
MIVGLDSAAEPTSAQALAAKASGVPLWSGYISTAPYDGGSHFWLWHPWSKAGFDNARLCGATPVAYCSGWDDPVALKNQAAAWGVRLCLDVENGIRGDGPWVQSFLDASGAGLYGNWGCHVNRRAAFHILAAYPGSSDPAGTWWAQTARPAGPCGWQWVGTHTEFGVGVDRGDYDDWFGGLYGGGQGGLGGFEMLDVNDPVVKQLIAAVTMPLPPRPARLVAYTDAQLDEVVKNSTWDGIATVYGPESRDWLYLRAHPIGISQAVANLKVNGQPATVDLTQLIAAEAAIKAELDEVRTGVEGIKAKTDKDLA